MSNIPLPPDNKLLRSVREVSSVFRNTESELSSIEKALENEFKEFTDQDQTVHANMVCRVLIYRCSIYFRELFCLHDKIAH